MPQKHDSHYYHTHQLLYDDPYNNNMPSNENRSRNFWKRELREVKNAWNKIGLQPRRPDYREIAAKRKTIASQGDAYKRQSDTPIANSFTTGQPRFRDNAAAQLPQLGESLATFDLDHSSYDPSLKAGDWNAHYPSDLPKPLIPTALRVATPPRQSQNRTSQSTTPYAGVDEVLEPASHRKSDLSSTNEPTYDETTTSKASRNFDLTHWEPSPPGNPREGKDKQNAEPPHRKAVPNLEIEPQEEDHLKAVGIHELEAIESRSNLLETPRPSSPSSVVGNVGNVSASDLAHSVLRQSTDTAAESSQAESVKSTSKIKQFTARFKSSNKAMELDSTEASKKIGEKQTSAKTIQSKQAHGQVDRGETNAPNVPPKIPLQGSSKTAKETEQISKPSKLDVDNIAVSQDSTTEETHALFQILVHVAGQSGEDPDLRAKDKMPQTTVDAVKKYIKELQEQVNEKDEALKASQSALHDHFVQSEENHKKKEDEITRLSNLLDEHTAEKTKLLDTHNELQREHESFKIENGNHLARIKDMENTVSYHIALYQKQEAILQAQINNLNSQITKQMSEHTRELAQSEANARSLEVELTSLRFKETKLNERIDSLGIELADLRTSKDQEIKRLGKKAESDRLRLEQQKSDLRASNMTELARIHDEARSEKLELEQRHRNEKNELEREITGLETDLKESRDKFALWERQTSEWKVEFEKKADENKHREFKQLYDEIDELEAQVTKLKQEAKSDKQRLKDQIEARHKKKMIKDARDIEDLKAELVKRQNFKTLTDIEIYNRFTTLVNEIDDVSRGTWDNRREQTWPFPDKVLQHPPKGTNTRELKQHIVQNTIWIELYEWIFSTPFKVFGEEGEMLQDMWLKQYTAGKFLMLYRAQIMC
jgi:hypothetical protein